MDIQLPDVSGLPVAQGGEHLRHIPVMPSGDRQKNQAGRMRSYIAKPFSIETSSELCAIISTSHSRANLFSNAAIPYQRK
jgi:hypothetical protein